MISHQVTLPHTCPTSAAILSFLQPLFYLLSGPQSLYGLTFGW